MNLFENSLKQIGDKASPEYLKAAAELFTLVEGMDSKIPLKATLRRPGEQPAAPAEPAATDEPAAQPAAPQPAAPDFSHIVEPIKTAVNELADYPAVFDKLMGSRDEAMNRLGMLVFATSPRDLANRLADLFQYYPDNAGEIVNAAYHGSAEAAEPAAKAVDKLQGAFGSACAELAKRSSGDQSLAALSNINKHFKPIYAPNDQTTNRFKKATGEKSRDPNKPTEEDVKKWSLLRLAGNITDGFGKSTNAVMAEIEDAEGDNSKESVRAKLDKSADIEILLFTGARQIVTDMDFVSEEEQKTVEMMYKISKYMITRQLRTLCSRKLPKEMSSQDVFVPTTVFGENYFDVTEYPYDEGTWLAGLPSGYITATVKEEYKDILLPIIKNAITNIRGKDLGKKSIVTARVNYVAPETPEGATEETEETQHIDPIYDDTFAQEKSIVIQVVPNEDDDIETLKKFVDDTIQNFKIVGIPSAYLNSHVEAYGDGSYYVGVTVGGTKQAERDIMLKPGLANQLYFVMSAIFSATYREAINIGCSIKAVGIDPAIRTVLEDPAKKKVVANLVNKYASSDFRDNKAFYRNNGAMDTMQNSSFKSVNRNEIMGMWADSNTELADDNNDVQINKGTLAVLYSLSEFIMNTPVSQIVTQLNQLIDGDTLPSKMAKAKPDSFLGQIRNMAIQKYGALDSDDEAESAEDVDKYLDEIIDNVFTNTDFIEYLCSRIYPQFVNGADVKKIWNAAQPETETDERKEAIQKNAIAINDMLTTLAEYINKVSIDKFVYELKALPTYDPNKPETMKVKPSTIAERNPDSFLNQVMMGTLGQIGTQRQALASKDQDIVKTPLDIIFTNRTFIEMLRESLLARKDGSSNFMDTGLSLYANVANKKNFDRTKFFNNGRNYDGSMAGNLSLLRDIGSGRTISAPKEAKPEPKKGGGFVAEFDGDEDEDEDIEL